MNNTHDRARADAHAIPSRQEFFNLLDFYKTDYETLKTLHGDALSRFHVDCANRLYDRLSGTSMLSRVAGAIDYKRATCTADLIPLLFPHSVYKSYPLRWLEEANFDKLTEWLQAFTLIDLSSVPLEDVRSIDDWIDALDRNTELRVLHTFGTSGKMSFIPCSRLERLRGGGGVRLLFRDFFGRNSGPDLKPGDLPVIFPSYRLGGSASNRGVEGWVQEVAGGDDNAIFLYPTERLSADVASLGGRLRRLAAENERGPVEIPQFILERHDEFVRLQADRPKRLEQFFEEVSKRYGGRDVYIFLLWPLAVEWAEEGLKRGISRLFGPGTIFHTGGGLKGQAFAAGWRERVFEFLGVDRCFETYGMSEMFSANLRCEAGNYHIHNLIVPFVLDPDTGEELPTEGLQTGRFAALDLNATSMWGGVVTGDRVTMGGWTEPCSCGRQGIFVTSDISRYSELRGGDDKITCAGVQQAHDDALEYLNSMLARS